VKAGYRLIDTANDYGNEHMIGEALQELFSRGVVTRDQLFIQSKLWNANHRWEPVFFGGKFNFLFRGFFNIHSKLWNANHRCRNRFYFWREI
jgi:aryl-alcohol dehydrogenase-like predicted oxidoreductase